MFILLSLGSSTLFAEFVQLLETMLVNQLLEMAVGVVAYLAFVVENHHVTFLGCVGFPFGQTFGVGVPSMCEG